MPSPNTSKVISFPTLKGMVFPRLESEWGIRTVSDEAAILALAADERSEVQVLMTSATRGCTAKLADGLPQLRLVVSQGAGQDKIDLVALQDRGIRVRSVGEGLTDDVADLAMALTHGLVRNIRSADHFVRSGGWASGRFEPGESLVGMTMGIAGLSGRIGQAIARRATVSRMLVAGLRRPSNEGLATSLHENLQELAKASDVLVLAMPGGGSARHVIGTAELKALGSNGRLVNVGRGDLVDTAALIEALENNVIAGAALDVVEGEPHVPERLAALSNVILTPHIGGATYGARARGAKIAEDEILAFLGSGR